MSLPYPRHLSTGTFRDYLRHLAGRYLPSDMRAEHRAVLATAGRGDIVIDAGANVGEIAFVLALRGAQVHAFEPNATAFEVLEERLGDWPNVALHRAAVGAEDGTVRLYLHEHADTDPLAFSTGSSVIAEKPNVRRDRFVDVPSVDLSRFIVELERPVKLLKMDIEGAEVHVVPHLARTGALALVERLVVETHERKAPALADATRAMREVVDRSGHGERVDFGWH